LQIRIAGDYDIFKEEKLMSQKETDPREVFIQAVKAVKAQTIGSDDKTVFRILVSSFMETAKFEPVDVARLCKVSVPTVNRWSRGVTAPHPLMRPSIADVMLRRLEAA
jgi:hypothetical protein